MIVLDCNANYTHSYMVERWGTSYSTNDVGVDRHVLCRQRVFTGVYYDDIGVCLRIL